MINTPPSVSKIRPYQEGLIAGGCILLAALSCIWWIYKQAYSAQSREIANELRDIASIAAKLTDGDLHKTLTSSTRIDTGEQQKASAPLVKLHQALTEISYIYTVVEKDGAVYFVLGTNSSAKKYHRLHPLLPSGNMFICEKPDPALLAALHEGRVHASNGPYRDEFGLFMSGYAPFYDSRGHIVGITGVDMSVNEFDSKIRALRIGALSAMALAALFSFIFGAILVRARLRALAFDLHEKLAEDELKRMNQQLIEQNAAQLVIGEKLRQQEADSRKLALIASHTGHAVLLITHNFLKRFRKKCLYIVNHL